MSRSLHLLLLVLMLASLLPATAPARAESPALAEETAVFVPLPRTCGGGLPPGENTPACCLFGYVFIDGEAVSGAKVTVSSAHGSLEDWTGEGPDSDKPYFRLSLSDAPLLVQPGDTFTIQVEYSSHRRTVTRVALAGAQQVDVVLPRTSPADLVFDKRVFSQGVAGTVLSPHDVAIDATGQIYVTDTGSSRIQVFSREHIYLYQWGTNGNAPGEFGSNPTAIAFGRDGSVYVTDTSNHRIQQFTRNGNFIRSWGQLGTGNGEFNTPRGIAVDSTGAVYVSDLANHRIQKFTSTGAHLLTFGGIGSENGKFYVPEQISINSHDQLYVADGGNNRIQVFASDGIWLRSLEGTGSGPRQFSGAHDVFVDRNDNVFIVDSLNHRIQKFDKAGNWLQSFGSLGSGDGQLLNPHGIAVSTEGILYVADSNNRIQSFSQNGRWLESIAPNVAHFGQISSPGGIAVATNGVHYIVDRFGHRIQRFNKAGAWEATWGRAGSENGQFFYPQGIAVDEQGFVYITDTFNNRVQKFTADGQWAATWSSLGSGQGELRGPRGVAVGPDGFIYVADTDNSRIVVFTTNGAFVRQWGSEGSAINELRRPHGVAVDSTGVVYVADTDNHRYITFTASGVPLLQRGSFGIGLGQFREPHAIGVDSTGSAYIADTVNHRIQKFDLQGSWAGSWGAEGGGKGQFDVPNGIAIGPDGRVYVTEADQHRAQILRPMRYTRPIATLVAVSTRSVSQGQPITLHGTGSDSDETPQLAALEWFLDDATTPFATGPTVSLATFSLAPGRHTITLRARDTEGETSDLQSTTVDVSSTNPQPGTPSRWTFLLYLGGDAPNMASFLSRTSPLGALYRLERAAPNAQVTVAALYDGPLPGGGDSFYYLFRPDGSFSQQSLGEVNMGDPQTLVAFARWGLEQAPADYTYLALADHADAIDGTVWDTTTDRNERLTPGEIRDALVSITEGGARPIDVLHFDGCLMGLLEPAYQVRGLARYLVASENLGWSAFAYDQYRSLVGSQTTPRELALAIAGRYATIVRATGLPFTIAALDLAQIDSLARATGLLADELLRYALVSETNRRQLSDLRAQVQKLDSGLVDYRLTLEDEYVDLDHWAELVAAGVADVGVRGAAAAVRQAHDQTVLFNESTSGSLAELMGVPGAGYELGNARGLGIYYPPRPSVKTYQVYIRGELHFVREQGWDEYLAAGLTVLPFDPAEPEPRPVEPLPLPRPGENPSTRFKLFLPLTRR